MTRLAEIGRRIAEVQERELSRHPAPKTKQRLLSQPGRSGRTRVGWLIAAMPACFALVALAFWFRAESRALEVTLSNGGRAQVGQWVGATDASLDLRFSDGSKVVLAPGSSARVAAMDASGARVVVERGSVEVAVAHVEGARWLFDVGPFTVRVTGTRFRAGWSPEASKFTLELLEGAVAVTGPVVGEERALSKGEALRVSVEQGQMELSQAPEAPAVEATALTAALAPRPDASADAPAEPTPSLLPARQHTSAVPSMSPSAAGPSAAGAPSWTDLARAGEYKKAFARAEADGLESILETAGATELGLLADVARFAGKDEQAATILSTQRRRFKGEPQAAIAAFMLGRAAFDDQKAYAAAAKWFSTYLEEQPQGPFAREALGRLAESRNLSGDKSGARTAARSYLAAYPEGPHADVARSILAQ